MVFPSVIIPFPWVLPLVALEESPGLYVADKHEGYPDYFNEGGVKALQRYFQEHPEVFMEVMTKYYHEGI